jgi:hypothetical protein
MIHKHHLYLTFLRCIKNRYHVVDPEDELAGVIRYNAFMLKKLLSFLLFSLLTTALSFYVIKMYAKNSVKELCISDTLCYPLPQDITVYLNQKERSIYFVDLIKLPKAQSLETILFLFIEDGELPTSSFVMTRFNDKTAINNSLDYFTYGDSNNIYVIDNPKRLATVLDNFQKEGASKNHFIEYQNCNLIFQKSSEASSLFFLYQKVVLSYRLNQTDAISKITHNICQQ